MFIFTPNVPTITLSDDSIINTPCSFVFKTKSDYSRPLATDDNKLLGGDYYTNYGCGMDIIKNTEDYFIEVYKCKNTQSAYGLTYNVKELNGLISKNELKDRYQRIK